MHAWLCENPIGVEALEWKELPTPEPKAGEVRIAIAAASLNFPDLLIVQNKYQMKPALPFVPGSEYAGTVEAVGEGVTHLKVGDAVAAFAGTGGFATHAVVSAALVMPLPPGFRLDDAAAFILTYGTTHHGLLDRGQLKAGETLLVLGAAGGVGTAAIQIGKLAGARVIAAASSDAKCELCRELGADATINYTTAKIRDELKALTGGKGPDVVYDPVGGDLAEPVFRSIAWRGRYLGDRLRAGRHSGPAAEPGPAQGCLDRRRLLGRVRPQGTEGQCQGTGRARRLVCRRQDQAGHRPAAADARAARRLRAHGHAQRARQAGDDQRLNRSQRLAYIRQPGGAGRS